MKDPKIFYRELDAILATIRIEKSDGNLIHHIINILETTFGSQLFIKNGRLYELRGNTLLLVYPENIQQYWTKEILRDSESIELVFKNRSYIYDKPEQNAPFFIPECEHFPLTTAIWIHDQERQYIIVFDLHDGWIREEISLFLNAVRTSLNYRLFTDIIGGRLEQAVEIQKSLLPKQTFKIEGYDIFGHSKPAELVGGDFYDYYDYDEGIFGISIGDASGHGIPAALLVRDVVVGLRMGLAKELRLVHTLKKLNSVIQRSTYSTNFVSLFIGEFEPDGHIFYANAGHPAPILISERGKEELGATGITLGFLLEITLSRAYIHMPNDSVLLLYTDGIIERTDVNEEQFGMKRLGELLEKNRKKSAKEISTIVYETVYQYGEQIPWEDDATIVVIKRLAK